MSMEEESSDGGSISMTDNI
jgi:hypothetical protein